MAILVTDSSLVLVMCIISILLFHSELLLTPILQILADEVQLLCLCVQIDLIYVNDFELLVGGVPTYFPLSQFIVSVLHTRKYSQFSVVASCLIFIRSITCKKNSLLGSHSALKCPASEH